MKATDILNKALLLLGCGIILLIVLGIAVFYVIKFIPPVVNYDDIEQSDGGFEYLIRDPIKKAAVCGYTYDPESGNNVITIPESYGKYPVKELGGYIGIGAPTPFRIKIDGIFYDCEVLPSEGSFDWYISKKTEFIYYDMVLNIGPNIRDIYAVQNGYHAYKKLYVVRVYVNCDPDNPNYYSEDGILYQKKDGKIVDGFLYWNQY